MYPADEYEDVIDRTELLKVNQEQALNPPEPAQPGMEGPAGAAPHAPMPRKPRPKRVTAGEAASGARLERAVKALVKASESVAGEEGGMNPIERCSISGCGHLIGYNDKGAQICWFHAEQQKLPVHAQWKREFAIFLRDNTGVLTRAATKRDNYGVLGHP